MANSVLACMLSPELTAWAGQPTYQEMTVFKLEMFQNLKVIASFHNGRHAGYLGILMDPTIYTTDYIGTFVPSADSGDYPCLPTVATVHEMNKICVCHKHELLKYQEYGAFAVNCCNQLQDAIHESCNVELEEASLGLAKKSSKVIFHHIIA